MIKLSKRLERISQFVDMDKSVIDVGTDHGFVPNFLCERGMKAPIFASDISECSLQKSIEFAKHLGNGDKITHIVTDGLYNVPSVEQIIMAGMGGILISKIIQGNMELCQKAKLILQPMQASEVLRKFLYRSGFIIDCEELVYEDRRYFEIFTAYFIGEKKMISSFDAKISPKLLEGPHPLFQDFLLSKIRYDYYILSKIQPGTIKARKRRQQLEEEIKQYEEIYRANENK